MEDGALAHTHTHTHTHTHLYFKASCSPCQCLMGVVDVRTHVIDNLGYITEYMCEVADSLDRPSL